MMKTVIVITGISLLEVLMVILYVFIPGIAGLGLNMLAFSIALISLLALTLITLNHEAT